MEYGSEAGATSMDEPGGRDGLSDLPTARQYNNVERELTPSAIRAILGESPEPEAQAPARRLPWQSYTLVALLVMALGYGAYLKWKTSRASASVSNVGALALRAERREGALRVSWSRDTPVVNHAKDGILSIRDGDLQAQELHLELEQLRTGSVVYSPVNKSVLFRLEVTGRDETKTYETVLALAPSKAHLTARLGTASRPAAGSSSRNRKSFRPPRSLRDFGEPGRVVLVDPPAQAASFFLEASALVVQLAIAQPKVAPLPPPEPQQDRIAPREPQPLPVTPALVAARPIHESLPSLPRAIRATVTSEVVVQIKIQVDESGRVVRMAPLGSTGPASQPMVSISEEAARQWRFAPAMRGNQPVASEVVLTFRYTPKTVGN
jgi:hypothetical protein